MARPGWAPPAAFCWTRMGAESGQALERILLRKDLERRAGGGLFVWGIGNGLGSGLNRLLAIEPQPQVLFSPIHGPAAAADENPIGVLLWLHYVRNDGTLATLPPASFVTSRDASGKGRVKTSHFALFCHAEEPLAAAELGILHFGDLRNLETKKPVGFSQVTAVVDRGGSASGDRQYPVLLATRLMHPYAARLATPVPLPPEDFRAIDTIATSNDESAWINAIAAIKMRYAPDERPQQMSFLETPSATISNGS